jgi:hypothetical protein
MSIQYMVRPTLISETSEKNISMDNGNLQFGTSCYEAGMIEVIKGIAIQEMDHMEYRDSSERVKRLNNEAVKAYEALANNLNGDKFEINDILNGKLIDRLKEMDAVYNQVAAAEAEDNFIEGFIRGYRYLKHLMEFHTVVDE